MIGRYSDHRCTWIFGLRTVECMTTTCFPTTDDGRTAVEFDRTIRDLLALATEHHDRRRRLDPGADLGGLAESRVRLDAARRRAARLGRRLGAAPEPPPRFR